MIQDVSNNVKQNNPQSSFFKDIETNRVKTTWLSWRDLSAPIINMPHCVTKINCRFNLDGVKIQTTDNSESTGEFSHDGKQLSTEESQSVYRFTLWFYRN